MTIITAFDAIFLEYVYILQKFMAIFFEMFIGHSLRFISRDVFSQVWPNFAVLCFVTSIVKARWQLRIGSFLDFPHVGKYFHCPYEILANTGPDYPVMISMSL